ncbi:PorP/SprF family type IX secretion system membrane protein [Perlabentimonas gracilis]|uniref:PorP/SprF family type IX secretion system membrane protein n=1 Tax=Perlabentimonas gracilis TaxID=2715279 RepID=UPI0014079532|nr:PorP/SprF family type IX secretion system membrane protein [Perlabentimonas gracilis]NHB69167.1 type IX secretion system membrane protein PorP/SprF [Perlabentimonas gracilis]
MKRTILHILILAIGYTATAQNAHFSQFYSNPLYLAPSFAGSAETSRFITNFREQWSKLPGNFTSYSFSVDHLFEKYNSGMGLMFFSDQAGGGKVVTTNIGYLYSYKLKVTPNFYLQPGISAYYYSRSVNHQSLSFADQFFNGEFIGTTSEVLPPDRVQHADFAFSVMGYTENIWGGFNLNHLMSLSPVLSQDFKYPDLFFSIFGGVKLTTKRTVQNRNNETLHLAFNLRNQAKVNQLDIGGYYFRKPLYLGIWYRGLPIGNVYNNSDALIFLLGVKYNQLVFNYSYDMSLGSLISTTGGSHEISIIYHLSFKEGNEQRRKYRKIPCPTFF